MRGLRPLKLPAAGVLLAVGASLARCSGDDTSQCDACVDVTPTPLAIALTPQEIWAHPGDAKSIAIALARGPGGDGDVAVTIESDAGLVADGLTISATQTQGALVVHVPASFAQGDTSLVVDAASPSALAKATLVVHVAGASGALDSSFGAGGVADLAPSAGQDFARALVSLQNGVVVGATHVDGASSMRILRLTTSGAIDSSFAETSVPGELGSLAMLPDGRIFAVGDVRDTKASFSAVRIFAGGGLDPTYAVTTSISAGDDIAYAGGVEPGGRLVAAGSENDASVLALARYTQVPLPVPDAGSDSATDAATDVVTDAVVEASPNTSHLDPTFGEGGLVHLPLDPSAGARSLLVASDGSLFALGVTQSSLLVAAHFGTDGSLDTSFGDGGTASSTGGAAIAAILEPLGTLLVAQPTGLVRMTSTGTFPSQSFAGLPGGSTATAIARDPASGAIYVGGFSGSPHACLLVRYTAALALDTAFANAGSLTWSAGDACDLAALAVDDAGKVVVLESITTSGASHMAVARFWP
jgi:uncharacterized delta-60 repeat protein